VIVSDQGDAAAKIPIVLTVKKSGNVWRITDVQTGHETSERWLIAMNDTVSALRCRRAGKGYSVIEQQWEGRAWTGI